MPGTRYFVKEGFIKAPPSVKETFAESDILRCLRLLKDDKLAFLVILSAVKNLTFTLFRLMQSSLCEGGLGGFVFMVLNCLLTQCLF